MNMNAAEISATVAALPELPEAVIAPDMLRAQGYRPNAKERAAIKARADFFESLGLSRTVNLKVVDARGALIGRLGFSY